MANIKCSRCGKNVSSYIQNDILVRAWVECPECVELLEESNEVKCDHKWQHQETKKRTRYGRYNSEWIRVDRYYCQNCLEIKELKKSEYSRQCPDWYL